MRILTFLALLLSFSCHGDSIDDLPGGYYYYSESKTGQAIVHESWKPGAKYIPCNVVNYDWDDRFIIARQIAEKDCWWEKDYTTSQEIGQTYYWIIEISAQQIYGPFKNDQFELQRNLRGITVDLTLNMDPAGLIKNSYFFI